MRLAHCRMEAELSRQGAESTQQIEMLSERVSKITGSSDSDKAPCWRVQRCDADCVDTGGSAGCTPEGAT